MIIENPDAFKSWLTSILEPLCDADPAALAKYVYALVKKDKPLEELRDGMLDQLDVFLQQETKPFVDMLFKALENNEYVKLMEKSQSSPQPEQKEPEKEPEVENYAPPAAPAGAGPPGPLGPASGAESPRSGLPRARSPHAGAAPRHRVVVCRGTKPPPPREHTLVKVLPLTELLEEPVDQPPRRRDRRENLRDDRRRRRSRSWERRTRARRHVRGDERDDRRRPSRSPSPRGRFRNRSPPPAALDRPNSRSRSRSPVPIREREHERERDRLRPRDLERDRMSRDREHRDRASRSRDRERSRERSRDRSHSMSPARAREPDHYKRRCRDFDEKGYCMRGDLCQWDHGADPVVLEDAALTSVLAMPPVPEYNPLTPDIWVGAGYPPYPPPLAPPPRELVPIPRLHGAGPGPGGPPVGGAPGAGGGGAARGGGGGAGHGAGAAPAPHKNNFDYNRLGGRMPPRPQNSGANCSLEVKKIPRGLNDITHLNNHFGKFGKIVNIQVCFEGDPEGALITFSNHTEANVAYKSTEAVLNNRFIKVFWHNPENKQENTAPAGQPKPLNNQHPHPHPHPHQQHPPASHNKVLINRENIKATADNKQLALAAEKAKEAVANGGEKKVAPKPIEKSKQVMEMHKRAQALLETQLQQQVLLIQRLEGGNVTGPQKVALMEAINSAQEGIEKLRKELVAYNRTLRQMQDETVARMSRLQLAQANAKKPKTREEAQKEILDAELDMFTKQQEGQDVTDIQKKIAELRRQMALQFPTHVVMRRHARGGRFNSASRFTRAPNAFVNHNQSVDHRPRALLVSGFENDESEALEQHFAQFGEIVSKELNPTVPELVLAYRARAHAELAAQQGRHYNDRTLTITWVANPKQLPRAPEPAPTPAATPAPTPTPADTDNGHEQSVPSTVDALLRFDDEDDDEGDRSWRR